MAAISARTGLRSCATTRKARTNKVSFLANALSLKEKKVGGLSWMTARAPRSHVQDKRQRIHRSEFSARLNFWWQTFIALAMNSKGT
jgi:hypothetical protein